MEKPPGSQNKLRDIYVELLKTQEVTYQEPPREHPPDEKDGEMDRGRMGLRKKSPHRTVE